MAPRITFTPSDYENALQYARERLRQESIYRKRQEEPGAYSFVEIENLGVEGWRSEYGLVIEPGQKLAPFRRITYNRDKARCEDFSCIPQDPRPKATDGDDDQPHPPSMCNFSEGLQVEFPVMGKNGQVLKRFVACGSGCYRFTKKRDARTGLPVATGSMITSHVGEDGRSTCRYVNTNLVMWTALPASRQLPGGEVQEGYNTEHVPPFAFGEPDLKTVHLTDSYCRFFKQYFDPNAGECYRTGWMKAVRFLFGTYFTNLTYELANPQEPLTSAGVATSPFLYATGRALYAAGAARTGDAVSFTVRPRRGVVAKRTIATPVVERATPEETDKEMAQRLARSHFLPFMVDADATKQITASIIEYVRANESRLGVARSSPTPIEKSTNELISALLDTAFRMQVMGVSEREARSMLLRSLLQHPGVRKMKGGLGPGCRLVGFALKLRQLLFSERATERRNRQRREVSELEALKFAEVNMGPPSPTNNCFLDVIKGQPVDPKTTVQEIWDRVFSSKIRQTAAWTGNFVKGVVVKTIQGVLDILDFKVFERGYDVAGNIPIYIGIDRLINTVLESASRACVKFVAEYGAASAASKAAMVMGEEVFTDVATRTFGFLVEAAVARMVVSMAMRLALDVFLTLAALAAEAFNVIGWVLLVGAVLGLILDLSLGLEWYNNVMTADQLKQRVELYEAAFADATDTTSGALVPVSPEELLSIAVAWERNIIDHDRGGSDYDNFLDRYFGESPIQNKSTVAFLQEAQFEYLGGRRVNSLGQPLHENGQRERQKHEHLATLGRKVMVETASCVGNYARVLQYNASRIDYLRAVGGDGFSVDERLRRDGIGCAAVAGLGLVAGLGSLVLLRLATGSLRIVNIGVVLAFIGLLSFITLSGLAYLHFYAMGLRNVRRAQYFDAPELADGNRLSSNAAMSDVRAKIGVLNSFLQPYFKYLEK